MKKEFNWTESSGSPLGYPIEVFTGGLESEHNFVSLCTGTASSERWGDSGSGGMSGGVQEIPNRLNVIWLSIVEDAFYELDTPLDYDKMLSLFEEGYYIPSTNEDPEPRKENFDLINVGFAPGGVVIVWVSGLGRQIEVGRYQGKRISQPEDTPNLMHEQRVLLNSDYRSKMAGWDTQKDFVKENLNKPIPYGLWDSYRKRYRWQLDFEFSKLSNTIPEKKEILINCYNGEEEELFGEYITKNYKADKKLHWDYLTDRGICWRVNFKFYDGNNEYWGGIDFNEEEIFNAFGEFSQEEDLKLSIYINKGRSMASVKLTNGKKEVWLTNNKIVINKVN